MSTEKPGEEKKPEAEAEEKAVEPEPEAAAEPEAEAAATEEGVAEPPPAVTETTPPPTAEMPPPPTPLAEDRRDFWDTAATYLKKAKDEVVRSSRVGKIRLDVARLKQQRKGLYAELGEKTYELLSEEGLEVEALDELKVAVDEKNALIAAKDAEIEAISAEEGEEEEELKESG